MMESTLPKWQAELAGTPAWLLQTFIGVLVVVVLSAWLLKKTRFGTEFWHVLRPCLDKKSNFKVLLVLAVMLVLLITEIRLFVLNTVTSNGIYTAMQDLDVACRRRTRLSIRNRKTVPIRFRASAVRPSHGN